MVICFLQNRFNQVISRDLMGKYLRQSSVYENTYGKMCIKCETYTVCLQTAKDAKT